MAEGNAPLILLVEDDRDINAANRCALELEGYRVVSADLQEQQLILKKGG